MLSPMLHDDDSLLPIVPIGQEVELECDFLKP